MTDAKPSPTGGPNESGRSERQRVVLHMMPRRRVTALVKPLLMAGFAVFVLGVTVVLPLLVHDDSYGEAPIPGTATVHLPAGPVDVTLSSEGLDDDASVPPLSIRLSGPDGTPPPAVSEGRQAKCLSSDCDAQTRIWVVQVPREADYRVTVDGEAYGKYQPTLTFGRFVWNDLLLALLALGTIIRWAVLVLGGVALIGLLIRVLVDARPAEEGAVQGANPPGAERLQPARTVVTRVGEPFVEDLVLDYPESRHGVAKGVCFGLSALILIGGPMLAVYSWFHLPGGVPVCWLPVVLLGLFIAGIGCLFGRTVRRWAFIRSRRANGDGWLRLSSEGFELHGRWCEPRRYAWRDIDEFMLVASRDDEGDVVEHVGLRFSPEHRVALANTRLLRWARARNRDEAGADVHLDGYWDGPLDELVDLLNGWLARSRVS